MFGHRYFGAAYYGPRYWGDGGAGTPEPPPEPTPAVSAGVFPRRRLQLTPRAKPEIAHGSVHVTGEGSILVIGHKEIEWPPDDEVLQFLGMI